MISSFGVSLPQRIFCLNCLSVTVKGSVLLSTSRVRVCKPRTLPLIAQLLGLLLTGEKSTERKKTFNIEREISQHYQCVL